MTSDCCIVFCGRAEGASGEAWRRQRTLSKTRVSKHSRSGRDHCGLHPLGTRPQGFASRALVFASSRVGGVQQASDSQPGRQCRPLLRGETLGCEVRASNEGGQCGGAVRDEAPAEEGGEDGRTGKVWMMQALWVVTARTVEPESRPHCISDVKSRGRPLLRRGEEEARHRPAGRGGAGGQQGWFGL